MHSIKWLYCRQPLVTLTRKTTLISKFCDVFHIFVLGEHRDFKFGTQVDRHNSEPTQNKPSQKRAWLSHVIHIIFCGPFIAQKWLKLELSNFVHRQTI